MKSNPFATSLIGGIVVASMLAGSSLLATPMFTAAADAPTAADISSQIEPNAGKWKTWLLKSGDQFRLLAPPNKAATADEIRELKKLASQRDAEVLGHIAFWNTGAPSYRWNEFLVSDALKHNQHWLIAARALSLMHAAISDATVAAWDSKYTYHRARPSEFDPSLKTALPNPRSPSYPSEHAVAAGAAAAVLAYLFPDEAKRFDDLAHEAATTFVQAGVQYPSDAQAGLELGRKVAELAITRGKADGSDAKWTGSVPTEPGHWTGTNPILPMAGTWKPWVLKSGDELRPPPPPKFDSPEEAADLKAVETYSRTPKSNADAFFWEYAVGGARAYWFWSEQLNKKLMEYRLDNDPPRAARAYVLVNIALYDAGVACWDGKYTYWAIRPFQLDPTFKPLFMTPNHPSYPAAHPCTSVAVAHVLAGLFPPDADALIAMGEDASQSRLWAGIHFPSDIKAGTAIGQGVAQRVLEQARIDKEQ